MAFNIPLVILFFIEKCKSNKLIFITITTLTLVAKITDSIKMAIWKRNDLLI